MFSRHIHRAAGAAGLALVLAGAVACGSSSSGGNNQSVGTGSQPTASTGGTTGANAADAKLVPASIKSKGSLTVAADASYAPNEFIGSDGKTVVGMDADLAKAIGADLGLKVNVVNETFDGIIPGIQSGKYDLGMSSFTDTKAREKVVDFVTYFSAGTSFFVKSSGGPAINSLADLCGHKVAVEKGTTQQADATGQSKKCTGGKSVDVEVYNDQNAANLALSTGKADVSMADSPVAAYQVKKSNGMFKLSGQPYGTAPYGIASPKGNGLDNAVLAAMKTLIQNGTYLNILKKWGIQAGAITSPVIDGATS